MCLNFALINYTDKVITEHRKEKAQKMLTTVLLMILSVSAITSNAPYIQEGNQHFFVGLSEHVIFSDQN